MHLQTAMGFPRAQRCRSAGGAGATGAAGAAGAWGQSLGWAGPLEEGMATFSSILAWRTPWTEEPVGYSPRGCKELDTTEATW